MNIKSLLIVVIIFITFSSHAKDKGFGNATVLKITSIYDGERLISRLEA